MLWTRNSGQTDSDDSGPERDHTTETEDGWYVYVPLDAQSDGVAILQSEPLGPYPTEYCFGFYYHIYDDWNTAPKLTVQFNSPSLTSGSKFLGNISSSDLDDWKQFNVTVKGLPQGRFVLETYEGHTSKADVAVDDIYIKPGACGHTTQTTTTASPTTPEPAAYKIYDCDFDHGNCKWHIGTKGWTITSWATSKLSRRGGTKGTDWIFLGPETAKRGPF